MKKLFTVLFATMIVGQVLAQRFQSGDLYYYVTSDSTVAVTYQSVQNYDNYSGLSVIEIPQTVTYEGLTYMVSDIGKNAFSSCNGCNCLTSITIPETVVSIGSGAFSGCSGLTSIYIPKSVTTIGENAFEYCAGLKSIELSNSVENIGDNAFRGCSSLTSVTIPNSVTSIGKRAFASCDNLTNVIIPDSIVYIGTWAFNSCNKLIYNEYDNALYLGNLNNPYVALIMAKSTDIPTCEINTNCKVIAGSAFQNCSAFATINIPRSVVGIGDNAFNSCKLLEMITIPNSVIYIRENAFSYSYMVAICCEAKGKPIGWVYEWNQKGGAVLWDYKIDGGNIENGENENNLGTAVTESAISTVNIYAIGNTIVVENATEEIRVYNAMGGLVATSNEVNAKIGINGSGVYLVKVGGEVRKVVVN